MTLRYLVVGLLLLVVVGVGVVCYNRLVALKNRVRAAEGDVDVALQRRNDLVPNLVETVKGYAAHEREVLESVVRARAGAQQAQGVQEKAAADAALGGALRNLLALAEQYPQLRAVESFTSLQAELAATEDRIAFARQAYNAAANDLNGTRAAIPYLLFAGLAGAAQAPYWQVSDLTARAAPVVDF